MSRFYSFYDTTLQLYNKPFECSDDKSAIKATRDFIVSVDSNISSKVLSVCELHYVGTFDDVQGIFIPVDKPKKVCSLSDIPVPSDVAVDNT